MVGMHKALARFPLAGEAAGILSTMAAANVDLVRSICAAWEQGDFSSAEWAHPEIEFVLTGGPVDGSWTGLDGMAGGWGAWLGAWEEFRAEADEYRELDDEHVLVLLHGSARGKTSGMELGQMRTKTAALFHLAGGKVTRLVVYLDRERGLSDLGLAPEADALGS
jgi:ketosteroid isomerase-like protein